MTSPIVDSVSCGSDDRLDLLLTPADLRAGLEADARAGLTGVPKWLPPKYFYDDRGSRLFEEITRLQEYYPTRAENTILASHASRIAEAAGAEALVELGSGASEKTRLLLDALRLTGQLTTYAPVDVSAGALRTAMAGLRADYPALRLHGAVADFDHHLGELPQPGRRLIALLGGTIGNYPPLARRQFLGRLAGVMQPGETFLVGLDLVKDPARLVAAYDDRAGVTAEFNRNVLRVLDAELGADFDPDDFTHVALWDPVNEWIEMRLRARRALHVRVERLGLDVRLAAGEEIRTEISAKFTLERIEPELDAAGLRLEQWWTDPGGDYALALARR